MNITRFEELVKYMKIFDDNNLYTLYHDIFDVY